MGALKLLADEFIRSAVTKIMPIMTPEMASPATDTDERLTLPEKETPAKQALYWKTTR
jgi:hypothetical protein